jgi:hypothetical protein
MIRILITTHFQTATRLARSRTFLVFPILPLVIGARSIVFGSAMVCDSLGASLTTLVPAWYARLLLLRCMCCLRGGVVVRLWTLLRAIHPAARLQAAAASRERWRWRCSYTLRRRVLVRSQCRIELRIHC